MKPSIKTIIETLPENEQALLLTAAALKARILIGGTRNKPTGKSVLCQGLRALGVDAVEEWELEESPTYAKPIDQTRNVAYLVVNLHVPIPKMPEVG